MFAEEMKNRDLWHNVGKWLLGNLNLVPLLYMGDHMLYLCRISVCAGWTCSGDVLRLCRREE